MTATPGPVAHEFKVCSTELCRNAWGEDEQQTVRWLRAGARAREKLHPSSTAWPEPISSRLHQGVTCLFIRTAVLRTCTPGGAWRGEAWMSGGVGTRAIGVDVEFDSWKKEAQDEGIVAPLAAVGEAQGA